MQPLIVVIALLVVAAAAWFLSRNKGSTVVPLPPVIVTPPVPTVPSIGTAPAMLYTTNKSMVIPKALRDRPVKLIGELEVSDLRERCTCLPSNCPADVCVILPDYNSALLQDGKMIDPDGNVMPIMF